MSNKSYMVGCGRIEVRVWKGILLELYLDFMKTNEDNVVSPPYIINGVINFKFKVERRNNDSFLFFVRFDKKRVNDKLDYTITYTHWTTQQMEFDTADRWHYVCEDWYCKPGTISVKVDLTTLASPYALPLYTDTELTDFKLLGDDGYVALHKAIAAANSPFFKNMFLGQWKETAEGAIEVPGISQATLEYLKEYMYLGTLPETCVRQLLLLSKFYLMEDLETRCLFKLRAELTKDNVFDSMEFAVANKQTRLLYEILDFAQKGELEVDEIEKFQKYL